MTDTAQPARPAADHSFVSGAEAVAAAAEAFKRSTARGGELGVDPGLLRDDEKVEGEAGAQALDQPLHQPPPAAPAGSPPCTGEELAAAPDDESEEGAEQAGEDGSDGDPDAPQPVPMPASWPKEDEALWSELPPDVQAKVAEREGQRDRAVNLKFQEAANLRKAHEAEIEEARTSCQHYAQAVDDVLSLVVPKLPPRSMLDRNSGHYDPDAYHYQRALHEDTVAFLNRHRTQRQQIAAQEEAARFRALNDATRDAFIAAVPDIGDEAKAGPIFQDLIDYALSLGTPPETFQSPTAAIEWHVLWKAREFDRLQAAKAKVRAEPRPEPRKPQPPVRPGVATRREAAEQQQRGAALDRLRQEGSVDAGAAAFKHLLKGNLS